MCGTDAAVKWEAAVLQYAVVLHPHVLAFVHFVKQSKTLWAFHCQWGQIRVVSGNIHPHVVLKKQLIEKISCSVQAEDEEAGVNSSLTLSETLSPEQHALLVI